MIPIKDNKLFAGKKGVYMDVSIFLNDEKDDYGNDGSIKQNAGAPEGKKWADLSDEEKEAIKALPYIGNVKRNSRSGSGGSFDDAKEVDPETDDLPF